MVEKLISLLDFDATTPTGITNIASWLAILIYFLFIYIFVVAVPLPTEKHEYLLYLFVLLIPPAIKVIIFGGDSIAHAHNPEAKFFQSQFPDKHVAAKFSPPLPLAAAQEIWFGALNRTKDEERTKRTFQYGYTCRLVYYVRRIAALFLGVSILALLVEIVVSFASPDLGGTALPRRTYQSLLNISNPAAKVLYVLNVFALWIFIIRTHRTSTKAGPTGVWYRWKHINDRNRAWVDSFSSPKAFRDFAINGIQEPSPTENPGDK